MTASRTRRSRVVSSWNGHKFKYTNDFGDGQGSGERVEPQPAGGVQPKSAVVADGRPACVYPRRHASTLAGAQRRGHGRPQCRDTPPRRSGCRPSSASLAFDADPRRPWRGRARPRTRARSSAAPAVEAVRRGPEPDVRHARPVGRVVPRARGRAARSSRPRSARAGRREQRVRVQELGLVALLAALDGLAASRPSARAASRFDRQPVQRHVRRARARQRARRRARDRAPARRGARRSGRATGSSMPPARAVGDRALDRRRVVRAVHPREHAVVELCTPSETRFTPAARHASTAAAVTSSGFASMVSSAPGASGNCRATSAIARATPVAAEARRRSAAEVDRVDLVRRRAARTAIASSRLERREIFVRPARRDAPRWRNRSSEQRRAQKGTWT